RQSCAMVLSQVPMREGSCPAELGREGEHPSTGAVALRAGPRKPFVEPEAVSLQGCVALIFGIREPLAQERSDMTIATKVAALLTVIRRQDVEELPPAEKQRLASLCRYVADLVEPQPPPLRSGVLYDLKSGRRAE